MVHLDHDKNHYKQYYGIEYMKDTHATTDADIKKPRAEERCPLNAANFHCHHTLSIYSQSSLEVLL